MPIGPQETEGPDQRSRSGRELGIPCGACQDDASFVGLARRAPLAQSAERFHGKEKVDSSILSGGSVPGGPRPTVQHVGVAQLVRALGS